MAKINEVKLDSHPRGDSGVINWSWVKKEDDGSTTPLSLVGYKAALTVKEESYDNDPTDETAMMGYNDTLWKVDIDCDDPEQMGGLDPAEGKIAFPIHKQATWIEPGTYHIDIVVENKSSHKTTTAVVGTIDIQGHPTNRLTTDIPD